MTKASLSAENQIKKSPLKVVSCELQKPFLQETFFEEGGCVFLYVRSEFLKRKQIQEKLPLIDRKPKPRTGLTYVFRIIAYLNWDLF